MQHQQSIELLGYQKLASGDEKPSKMFSAFSLETSKKTRPNEDRMLFGELPDLDFLKNYSDQEIISILKEAIANLSKYIDSLPVSEKNGSTLTGCLQIPDANGNLRIFTYNLGDSFGLFREDSIYRIGDSFAYFFRKKEKLRRLTEDHDFSPKERERLNQFAKDKKCQPGDLYGEDRNGKYRYASYFINMSRSLGDKHCLQYGLSRDPSIKVHRFKIHERGLLLSASDGVNQGVPKKFELNFISFLLEDSDPDSFEGLAERFCKKVRENMERAYQFRKKEYLKKFGENSEKKYHSFYGDDCTVVITRLSKSGHVVNQAMMDGHTGDEEYYSKRKNLTQAHVSQIAKDKLHEYIEAAALKLKKGEEKLFKARQVDFNSIEYLALNQLKHSLGWGSDHQSFSDFLMGKKNNQPLSKLSIALMPVTVARNIVKFVSVLPEMFFFGLALIANKGGGLGKFVAWFFTCVSAAIFFARIMTVEALLFPEVFCARFTGSAKKAAIIYSVVLNIAAAIFSLGFFMNVPGLNTFLSKLGLVSKTVAASSVKTSFTSIAPASLFVANQVDAVKCADEARPLRRDFSV